MVTVIVIILLLLMCSCRNNVWANIYHRYDSDLERALLLINSVHEHINCTDVVQRGIRGVNKQKYALMTFGVHGGFAAQFQLAAAEWMRLFAATEYKIPVLITGRIVGYSDGDNCATAGHEWTCYFHPMTNCDKELLRYGKQVHPSQESYAHSDEETVPEQFRGNGFGLPFWWGVVQFKMFRLQSSVEHYIQLASSSMNQGFGFPFGTPVGGMHVRHGDKGIDGFREHSLKEGLRSIRKSGSNSSIPFSAVHNQLELSTHNTDCAIMNSHGDCFSTVNLSTYSSIVLLHRVTKHRTSIMRIEDIESYNRTGSNFGISLEPKAIMREVNYRTHSQSPVTIDNSMNCSIADDGDIENGPRKCRDEVKYVIPTKIFVASDDSAVLQLAASKGYMTGLGGVSQQTNAADGMLKTLLTHPEMANMASLEIIADIYFLSQCSSLVGMAASQVYRMSVSLANVTGTLRFAGILDGDQLGRVQSLSRKYNIPFPENFVP